MKCDSRTLWRTSAVLAASATGALLLALARDPQGAAAAGGSNTPAIDPVAVNGPIFEDWPQPTLALVFSGELDGYLEPCGCAGLENQLGGLKRRHTLVKQLVEQGWPLALLDLGGLAKRTGVQAEIKYRYALESLVEIGYQAVGLGAGDLRLNADQLAFAMMNIDPAVSPLVSANVGVYGFDGAAGMGSARFRVLEVGGKRIGVTSVLGARHETLVKNNPDVEFQSPAAALSFVAPQLAAANCDLQVLLVHGDPREAAELSRQFPQFQVVATAGGADEPPAQIRLIEGSGAAIVETGHKGMYVTVLAFFDHPDPSQRNRYQRVPLDARFAESPQMQAKLTNYQKELQTNGLDGLGLTPVAHPDGEFAGSAACADCHTAAWEVFEKTPHAHATDTLVNLTPARHFDPECLSCHVTGWDPQQYTPYVSGYLGLDSTPHLTQNGCENCHGPAAAHVAAENGEIDATEEELESLRAALRMKIVPNEGNKDGQEFENGTVVKNCMQCHDQDNSPDFDFQEYWPHVRHDGVD